MKSSRVINENVTPVRHNHEHFEQHQRHLFNCNDKNTVMTSHMVVKDSDCIGTFVTKSDLINPPEVPHTPKRSNFEKLRLVFEEKMKGNEVTEIAKPGHSPSLTRLMQLNDKKLNECLKSKRELSNKKKLKKFEKEAKLAKDYKERLKVRDIQVMFDKMAKSSAVEGSSQYNKAVKPKLEVNMGGIYGEKCDSNDREAKEVRNDVFGQLSSRNIDLNTQPLKNSNFSAKNMTKHRK